MNRAIYVTIFLNFIVYGKSQIVHKQEMGNLHLSQQRWEFIYELNLQEYFETSILLDECIKKLQVVCNQIDNPMCDIFLTKSKQFLSQLEEDTATIKGLQRSKRALIAVGVFIVGVTVIALIASIAVQFKAVKEMKQEIRDTLNNMDTMAKISKKMIENQEKQIEAIELEMRKVGEGLNNLTNIVNGNQHFNNLLHIVSMSMIEHNRIQNKLINIYSDDIKLQMINMIDFDKLRDEFDKTYEQLGSNFMLPPIESLRKLKFITSELSNEENIVRLKFLVPVISRTSFKMFELIPIPFDKEDDLYILNMEQTKFIEVENQIYSINGNNFPCEQFGKITVCNTIFYEYLTSVNTCVLSLLNDTNTRGCTFKRIEKKNYIFQITKFLMYFHIVDPIDIKLSCGINNKILKIEHSMIFKLDEDCVIYKYMDEDLHLRTPIFSVDATYSHPRIQIYNFKTKTWDPNTVIIPKYEIKNIEIKESIEKIKSSISLQKEKIEKIDVSMGSFDILEYLGIKQYLENLFIQIGLIILGILLFLMIVKIILKKIFK